MTRFLLVFHSLRWHPRNRSPRTRRKPRIAATGDIEATFGVVGDPISPGMSTGTDPIASSRNRRFEVVDQDVLPEHERQFGSRSIQKTRWVTPCVILDLPRFHGRLVFAVDGA